MYATKDRTTFVKLRQMGDTVIVETVAGVRQEMQVDDFLAAYEPMTAEIGQEVAAHLAKAAISESAFQEMFAHALAKAQDLAMASAQEEAQLKSEQMLAEAKGRGEVEAHG